MTAIRRLVAVSAAVALVALGSACSDSSNGGSPAGGPACATGQSYDSTFEAIQKVVFERNGCTQELCHGSAAQGGLNLSPDVAYDNLFDVPSTSSPLKRIEPGDRDRSLLWLKLVAKTKPELLPSGVSVPGAPMPNGLPPIGESDLEAIRLWIYAGAPRTGTVAGTETLLDACLPELKPITIKPLDPPAPGAGVQFVLPTVHLPAHTEQEVCFAIYYDLTDQVPTGMQDPSGQLFRYDSQELRQDPQSHHLTLSYSGIPVERIHDPAFGTWTCAGGERAGEACEPTDRTSCGAGICRSEVKPTVGCVGYGPQTGDSGLVFQRIIGGAQQTQAYLKLPEGVFAQIPMKGILYWNSHAFNLTAEDHELNGRLNYTFAKQQRSAVAPIFDVSHVFDPNAAPYTTGTYCAKHVLAQGARLFTITSHTHKRGKRFWAMTPDGKTIYQNEIYNDPVKQHFDPPLAFDSPDPEQRTLTYCAFYNNGVAEDGSPDPETVTRASRVPPSARLTFGKCNPVACASGKIGAPCKGTGDDASCDSATGAGDGLCDACAITGGESTENEMFLIIGSTYIADGFPQPNPDDPVFGGIASAGGEGAAPAPQRDASGRSLYTGIAVPPDLGCGMSAASHAAHLGHAEHAAAD